MKSIRFILVGVAVLLFISSAAFPAVIRVKTTGNDAYNGSTWALAKQTVQNALDASASGGEIWVAAGTYIENITMPVGVSLYGGFVGTEVTRNQRNFWLNDSILDGGDLGTVVSVASGATLSTRIDGFTIKNGSNSGIKFENASPTIINNIIQLNTAENGGGISCSSSNAMILNNSIVANAAITTNPATYLLCTGGGIDFEASNLTIANNIFFGNTTQGGGGGIAFRNSTSPVIRNNTFIHNYAFLGAGGGIAGINSSPTIVNNIVAYCDIGAGGGIYGTGGTPVIHHNCLYNNQPGGDYQGDWVGGAGDVYADPQVIEPAINEDIHIKSTSPCVNAGSDGVVQTTDRDFDKQKRIQGTHVDIGADEVAVWQIDLNGDRYGDLVGLNSAGKIYYTTNRSAWSAIPGTLSKLVTGDFNDDGNDDIAGLGSTGKVYYTTNKSAWVNIPGALSSLITGDFNGDGYDDIAGLTSTGKIYYTTDLAHWTNIPGTLAKLTPVNLNDGNNGTDDIAGLSSKGAIYWTRDLKTWNYEPGLFASMAFGEFYGWGWPEVVGLKADGSVWYMNGDTWTWTWTKMPGSLSKLAHMGDFNGDGKDDILGLSSSNKVYYSTNKTSWINIPGTLSTLVTGDFNLDGKMDIAGIGSMGKIYYTTNKTSWVNIPGGLTYLCPGSYSTY